MGVKEEIRKAEIMEMEEEVTVKSESGEKNYLWRLTKLASNSTMSFNS